MIRKSFAAVALGAALLLGGCGAGPGTAQAPPATPVQAAAPSTAAAELPKSDPVSLDIPSIGAHSSLVPLGLNADNTVQVPPVSTPLQAGWYKFGPTPGRPARPWCWATSTATSTRASSTGSRK